MTDKPGVYDFAAIAQYAKQQEAEKMANIMGRPLEDAKPVEAPADIDWTGMYGYPCGYNLEQNAAYYESLLMKPAGSFKGVYMGVPVFEVKDICDAYKCAFE